FPENPVQRETTDACLIVGQQPAPAGATATTSNLASAATRRRIQSIRRMEAEGAEVMTISADVCDARQMAAVRQRVTDRFGVINGVIHAAASQERRVIRTYDAVGVAAELGPKVFGTVVLHDLFRQDPLDFFLLCSSLASISAGMGDAGYSAANAFLDAFAQSIADAPRFTVSVVWDRWRGVGQAVPFEVRHRARTGAELPGGFDPEEGTQAFERLLSVPNLSQVFVSPMDFKQAVAAPSQPAT